MCGLSRNTGATNQVPKPKPSSTLGFNGVVLTHTNADFDTLASAVGLAVLRDHNLDCPGKTAVVLPQVTNK